MITRAILLLLLPLVLCAQSLTKTTLSADVTSGASEVTLASVTGLAAGDIVYIDREAMRVSAVKGTTAGVSRGIATTAAAHVAGTTVWYGDPPQFVRGARTGKCAYGVDPAEVLDALTGNIYSCPSIGAWRLSATVAAITFAPVPVTPPGTTSRVLAMAVSTGEVNPSSALSIDGSGVLTAGTVTFSPLPVSPPGTTSVVLLVQPDGTVVRLAGVTVSPDGLLTVPDLVFTNPQWEDVRAPVYSLSQGATPPNPMNYGTSGTVRTFGFAVGEESHGSLQLPHGYKVGSDVYPHVHWSPLNATVCNVKWSLDYHFVAINGAATAPSTITVEQATSGTAWSHQLGAFSAISGSGLGISSVMLFRLSRVAASSNDCAADAALLEFDIHIQKDTVGSDEATSK